MADSSFEQAPKKTYDKIAFSGAEVVLLVLLVIAGVGIWVWVEREFREYFYNWEPNEQWVQLMHHVPERQDDLVRVQEELKAVQQQLVEARLEQLKQGVTRGTLVAIHPELAKDPSGATVPVSFPAATLAAYKEAQVKELVAQRLAQSLSGRVDALKSEVEIATTRLEESKRSAGKDFHRASASYHLVKPGVTLLATLSIVLVLLFLVWWFVPARARERMSTTQSWWPFLIVVGTLCILFGYQAFEVAGAALVALVVLLILLTRIPWPAQTGSDR